MKKLLFIVLVLSLGAPCFLFGQQMSMNDMKMTDKTPKTKKDVKTVYPVLGKIRTYYIAADEVLWDYMPGDNDPMTGKPYTGGAKLFAESGPTTIGKVYLKALYREYTDASFTKLKPRGPNWLHMGILGPLIRAEVGDVIHVVFRNNASIPYSMHPHGVFYEKPSEGAVYNNSKSIADKDGSEVQPHGSFTYVWEVPARAGPGPGDPSSLVWLYHSHVDEPRNVSSGLVGAMIISARGTTKTDGTPKDVDREFVTLFSVFDENDSWYLDQNIKSYCTRPDSIKKFAQPNVSASILPIFITTGFAGLNFRFTINGYSFGTMPIMTMKVGERVRWYLISLGNGINFHTPHWHGNVVLYNKNRTDVIALAPAQMAVADMVPDNPGMWMFHCHVDDHMAAGMMAMYQAVK